MFDSGLIHSLNMRRCVSYGRNSNDHDDSRIDDRRGMIVAVTLDAQQIILCSS